jgi:hypothetical protein
MPTYQLQMSSVASMLPDANSAAPDPTEFHSIPADAMNSSTTSGHDEGDSVADDWLQVVTQHTAAHTEREERQASTTAPRSDRAVTESGSADGRRRVQLMDADRSSLPALLAGYSSEEDDSSHRPIVGASERKGANSSLAAVSYGGGEDATTRITANSSAAIIALTALVCKIGNRTFRKELQPEHAAADRLINSNRSNHTPGGFSEVFDY